MEQIPPDDGDPLHTATDNTEAGWQRYDAAPRDGPAVFVVDAVAWDHGEVCGAWVDPRSAPEQVASEFARITGRNLTAEQLTVVDQLGLGEIMTEEELGEM